MSEITEKIQKPPYKKWISIAVIIFLLISTLGMGPLSINLYHSEVRKDEVAYSLNNGNLNFDSQTYQIEYYLNEKLYNTHVYGASQSFNTNRSDVKPMEVHAEIVNYQGNYFLPFYKDYSVKYNASLNGGNFSEVAPTDTAYSAKVEGTIKIRVYGICSLFKARDIAQKSIMDSVTSYINQQMTNAMSQ